MAVKTSFVNTITYTVTLDTSAGTLAERSNPTLAYALLTATRSCRITALCGLPHSRLEEIDEYRDFAETNLPEDVQLS